MRLATLPPAILSRNFALEGNSAVRNNVRHFAANMILDHSVISANLFAVTLPSPRDSKALQRALRTYPRMSYTRATSEATNREPTSLNYCSRTTAAGVGSWLHNTTRGRSGNCTHHNELGAFPRALVNCLNFAAAGKPLLPELSIARPMPALNDVVSGSRPCRLQQRYCLFTCSAMTV